MLTLEPGCMASKETTVAEPGVPNLPTTNHLEQSNAKCQSSGLKGGEQSEYTMGSSKGQDQIGSFGSLDELKCSHRRRGTLSPPVLEDPRAPEEHTAARRRAPKQLDPTPRETPLPLETRCRRRHTQPTPQRSPQPIFVPKTTPSRRLRRQGHRHCSTMLRISLGRERGREK